MILVVMTPAIGLISRYERDKAGIVRRTHCAQAEPEERPYTFNSHDVSRFSVVPNEAVRIMGPTGLGERISSLED
jgi:hypothetical protein